MRQLGQSAINDHPSRLGSPRGGVSHRWVLIGTMAAVRAMVEVLSRDGFPLRDGPNEGSRSRRGWLAKPSIDSGNTSRRVVIRHGDMRPSEWS